MGGWGVRSRIAAFVGAAALVFATAFAAGGLIAPEVTSVEGHAEHGAGDPARIGGLQVSEGGYRLQLADAHLAAEEGADVRFAVIGPDGAPVTAFDEIHERPLHLIAVRRDLTGFQHVHPELEGGTWRTGLDLTPGAWRIFTDFRASGDRQRTLGADLLVAGDHAPERLGPATREVEVDGYRVTLDGDVVAGEDARLTFEVSRDGEPVTLQPYLGAQGHLVILRAADLGYLHTHAEGDGDVGTVGFHAELPDPVGYRMFLDFRHDDVVRTAAFTVYADPPTGTAGPDGDDRGHDHGEGDHDH